MGDEQAEHLESLILGLRNADDCIDYYDNLSDAEQEVLCGSWLGRRTRFFSECRQLRKDLEPLVPMMQRHPMVVRVAMGGTDVDRRTDLEEAFLQNEEH